MLTDDELWEPMKTAPRDATEIVGLMPDGNERTIHWASDLSGSEQPPFEGWFYRLGSRYVGCEPVKWRPLPPVRR